MCPKNLSFSPDLKDGLCEYFNGFLIPTCIVAEKEFFFTAKTAAEAGEDSFKSTYIKAGGTKIKNLKQLCVFFFALCVSVDMYVDIVLLTITCKRASMVVWEFSVYWPA